MNFTLTNVINIIQLISLIIFTNYIYRLEETECKCSENWTRDFIKYYSITMIVLSLFSSFQINFNKKNPLVMGLLLLISFANLFFVYVLWKYNKFLCERECECSSGWEKDFMNFYTFTIIVIIVIQVVFSILLSLKKK